MTGFCSSRSEIAEALIDNYTHRFLYRSKGCVEHCVDPLGQYSILLHQSSKCT